MPTTSDSETVSDAKEIQRLVMTACQQGKPDKYTGKRRWMRFSAGMRLEITSDASCEASAPVHVIMQNVSEGGFAFWSKRELFEHTPLFVREFSTDQKHEWIAAHVRHCTVGIRGFLVGAEFDSPPEEAQFPEPPAKAEPAPKRPAFRTAGGKRLVLPPQHPRR